MPQPHVVAFHEKETVRWLIRDDSADKNILALALDNGIYAREEDKRPIYNQGRILLLPDFGDNNCNVALALLQEAITQISPHLFDVPQHPWLEEYQPAPVLHFLAERETLIKETIQKIEEIKNQVEIEREKYAWLSGLVISLGDQFETDVAQALRFLGFKVEEIDNELTSGKRKREDYRIWDETADYFALGEAKTTGKGRGASENFITKTQTHQARYAREYEQSLPPALLIVNYATDLDPSQRAGRFYQTEVSERLEDNGISAINSVALFDLCQYVLNKQLSQEQVRRFIVCRQPLITSVTLEDVLAASEPESPAPD